MIPNTVTAIQYPGNGAATQFPFGNKVFAASDLFVRLIYNATGGVTLLNYPADFSVQNVDVDTGCTVITTVAPASGYTLDIRTVTSMIQGISIKNQGRFLPELHEEAFDRVTRELQDLYRLSYLYSVHGPDSESIPWAAVPAPSGRLNTSLGFDGAGTLGVFQTLAAGVLSRASIGGFLYPQTAAEALAGVVPVDYGSRPGYLLRYDSAISIASDATNALTLACSVGQEVTIDLPYSLASASLAALANKGIPIKTGTTIRGQLAGSLTVTGTVGCNVFYTTDTQNIRIEKLVVIGNGNAGGNITTTTGYFWYCKASAAPGSDLTQFYVTDCKFTNFGGLYWIYFDNTLATNGSGFAIRDIKILNNTVVSAPNNAQNPSAITYTACFVAFSGSDIVTNYASMTDLHVNGNTANGTYLKQFCIFWSGVNRAECSRNLLQNFGVDGSFTNDTGCYALEAYDHAHGTGLNPDTIVFNDNIIQGVRDCGIYLAAVIRADCNGNKISGQTSTANGTIPKGAIAISSGPGTASIISINDTTIDGCYIGITAVAAQGCDYHINKTHITNVLASGNGLLIQPTQAGTFGQVIVDGLKVWSPNATVTAVRIDSNATIGLAYCSVLNFDIDVPYTGINQVSVGATVPLYGLVKIAQGIIRNTTNAGINWTGCSNAATRVVFENIEFYGQGQNCAVFNATGTVGMRVNGITFMDMATGGTGFCWYGSNAQGSLEAVRYRNIATANRYQAAGSDLGVILPAWTGNLTDFVQDLNVTELGAAASKYLRMGWQWDRTNAAWKEARSLTGN